MTDVEHSLKLYEARKQEALLVYEKSEIEKRIQEINHKLGNIRMGINLLLEAKEYGIVAKNNNNMERKNDTK